MVVGNLRLTELELHSPQLSLLSDCARSRTRCAGEFAQHGSTFSTSASRHAAANTLANPDGGKPRCAK